MIAIVTEIRNMVVGFVTAIERLNVSMETISSCVYNQGSYGPYMNTFKYSSPQSVTSEEEGETFWTEEVTEEYRVFMDAKSDEFIRAKKEKKYKEEEDHY